MSLKITKINLHITVSNALACARTWTCTHSYLKKPTFSRAALRWGGDHRAETLWIRHVFQQAHVE